MVKFLDMVLGAKSLKTVAYSKKFEENLRKILEL
jgi:hypothetical protein